MTHTVTQSGGRVGAGAAPGQGGTSLVPASSTVRPPSRRLGVASARGCLCSLRRLSGLRVPRGEPGPGMGLIFAKLWSLFGNQGGRRAGCGRRGGAERGRGALGR